MLNYNLVVLSGGEALTRAITFVAFVYLARVFEPAVFGLVELTLAVMMFCTLAVNQGFGMLGTREIARSPDETHWLVSRIVSAQLILSVVVYAALVSIVLCLPIGDRLTILLLGYGVSLFAVPFSLNWVFQGRQQMMWVALPQVLRHAVFLIFVLLLIRRPEQVVTLPLAELAAVAAASVMYVLAYTRSGESVTVNVRAGLDRRLFAESLPIGGSQMIWVLRMYLPTLMIGFLADQTSVGLYGAAHRIVMVFTAIMQVYFVNLFPIMSQASTDSAGQLTSLMHRSLRLLIWPSLVLALATSSAAATLISFVFGQQYAAPESVAVFSVLIWIIPVLAWRSHCRNALIAINRQREDLVCSLIGLALLIGFLIPSIHAYGAMGSAWVMVFSELATTILLWWRLRRHVPNLALIKNLLALRR